MIKIYDLMIFGVKEYRKIREKPTHVSNSNVSYIDSCCYQTFRPKGTTSRFDDISASVKFKMDHFSIGSSINHSFQGVEDKENLLSVDEGIDETSKIYMNSKNKQDTLKYQSFGIGSNRLKEIDWQQQKNKREYASGILEEINKSPIDHFIPKEQENNLNIEINSDYSESNSIQPVSSLRENDNMKKQQSKPEIERTYLDFQSNSSAVVSDLSIICFETLKEIIQE